MRDTDMTIGKYKGTPIALFNTPDRMRYLYWVRNTPSAWAKLSRNVQDAINKRIG